MDVNKVLFILCSFVAAQLFRHGSDVMADECGTRFTDFTSSTVLAQVVLEGTIKDFNARSLHSQVRSANVTVQKVFKGMEVLKEFNRSISEGDDVMVHHFGVEDRDNCIAPDDDQNKGQDIVFFLRQTSHRGMLRLSAMPVAAPGGMDRRVRRSLCDTCLRPPEIKRLVCQDCAKEPTIRTMKSKKAKIGRRARLRCLARGKPTPTITWAKGNIPVVSGTGGITIRTSETTSILIFSRVSQAHSGRYKCIATNKIGQTEEVVTLNVTSSSRRSQTPSYSVETAPDRVTCQHNPCLNGGSCIFSPSLDLRRCLCATGFEGVQCENDLSKSDQATNQQFNRVLAVSVPDTPNSVVPVSTNSSTATGVNNERFPRQNFYRSTNQTTSTKITLGTTTQTTTHPTTRSLEVHTTTSMLPPLSRRITESIATERRLPRVRPPVISKPTGQIHPRYPVSKKSNLKSIPCFEKNYCKNRGKCRFIRKLNRKFCKCRSGFFGPRCENKL